jgi:hypothetical protein
MIREIKESFKKSEGLDLERFLIDKELEFKEKYQVGEILFYLNLNELLAEENSESKYFKQKQIESLRLDNL